MATNNRFFKTILFILCLCFFGGAWVFVVEARPNEVFLAESTYACNIPHIENLTTDDRLRIADCLGWVNDWRFPVCLGHYEALPPGPYTPQDAVEINADSVSLFQTRRSILQGHVQVTQNDRRVNAETAYVYRDKKTHAISQIVLLGPLHYIEPDKLVIARHALINVQDKSGQLEDALYRLQIGRQGAILPAWGQASLMQRFPNKDLLFHHATYTTCSPLDKAWELRAKKIYIDDLDGVGTARDTTLRVHDIPIAYLPYFSFPTTQARKSGFLFPIPGYSETGGFDLALPYYWNMAPNYDATLIPHPYGRRGMMMGGAFRFLTPHSSGIVNGDILPQDRVFKNFLKEKAPFFPNAVQHSANRWSFGGVGTSQLAENLTLHANFEEVSDPYYFQDFSTNFAIATERQLLREATLAYTTAHWLYKGMVQSYQTLHPIDEPLVLDIYERLPQLLAQGDYGDLPLHGRLSILGQYDQYRWPTNQPLILQGPRFHLNPILSFPQYQSFGYLTPSVQWMETHYAVSQNASAYHRDFNRSIPIFQVDSSLVFERNLPIFHRLFTQTLEPRVNYLNVPFVNQTALPVYDSAYMIFNYDQLFRINRFSGFDRIGDANQLSYALTTRFLSEETGIERASLTIGQIRYFRNRRVQLCQNNVGDCFDSPLTLGFLPLEAKNSPIASRGIFNFNPSLAIRGDYIWNPSTHGTNNAGVNLHFQPATNHIISLGYVYILNGDLTPGASRQDVMLHGVIRPGAAWWAANTGNALQQATVAYAWPFSAKWSSLGAYNYNMSKDYEMMSFFGLQYDSCCVALRFLGGRTFKNLDPNAHPVYNNAVYVQILLKGLGTVGNGDPITTINTFIPGYADRFHP